MAGYGYQPRNSAAYTDDWSKPSYGSDHVCRPVIIDAEGRKRPIVSFTPNQNSEYYVTRTTETIVQEQVVLPIASEIKHPSPTHDISPKVDEFFSKLQTEASRPKFGPMSASTWRQSAKPTATGYGSEFNDYNNNNDWKKATSNGYRDNVYDDNYGKYGSNNNSGLNKPSYTTLFTPNSNISKPTSDIPAAIEMLEKVAKPFISEPKYTEIVDSIEAAKRYGNFGKLNFSPKPYAAENNYTTMDGRAAAWKY